MTDFVIKRETTCSHCGKKQSRIGDFEAGRAPEPGDFAICIKCGGWNIIADDGGLRRPTESEEIDIATSTECHRARCAWEAMDAEMRRKQ